MTVNSFDWDEELAPETEEEVYQALLRALQRKQGFGLFFVQCTKAQGEKITANLRQDLSQQKIEELHLQGEVVTLYDQIAALWNQQQFDVLVIEGLQASLYAYEDTKRFSGWSSEDLYHYSWKGVPQILNHLNQQREHLRNDFPVRLVFLVPAFVVDYFIQRAADFLDWRSGLFRFPRHPKEIAQDVERFAGAGDCAEYVILSSQERIAKILELKSLQESCLNIESKVRLLSELGLLFVTEQDYGNAVVSWEKALECKANDHETWFRRGVGLIMLKRYEEAIASYDKALEIKPNNHEAWWAHGLGLIMLDRYEEAIASYDKALEIKPNNHEAWLNRSDVLHILKRYEEAIASYDKALEIKPDLHKAWEDRGLVLAALKRYEEAIASWEKALEIKPDLHEAWHYRSLALSALGDYEEAIASYDKALEIKPDSHKTWLNRSNTLFILKRYEEAITSYDKALEIKPDFIQVWDTRGLALSALGRYEEAISSLDQALKYRPDDYKAWENRGIALIRLGRYEQALVSYNKVIEIKPNNKYAVYKKAACYSLQGDIQNAVETLQQAVLLDSEYREMAKTDSDFDLIRQDDRFQELLNPA
jgi:tetratricopeptide (TPR) repeat protein